MARSSDETVEVSANDERRMCGLAGDDDETVEVSANDERQPLH